LGALNQSFRRPARLRTRNPGTDGCGKLDGSEEVGGQLVVASGDRPDRQPHAGAIHPRERGGFVARIMACPGITDKGCNRPTFASTHPVARDGDGRRRPSGVMLRVGGARMGRVK
jgi:hypothetical protein